MRTFKNVTFAVLAAGLALAAHAQTNANLTGTVTDGKTGQPVAGAKVELAFNPSVNATTDAQGNFTLSGAVTGLVAGAATSGRAGMTLSQGALRLDVAASATPVLVEVYGLDSRRVKTLVDSRLAAGQYSIQSPVADLPAGVYVVRGRIGSHAASLKVSSAGVAGASLFASRLPMASRLAKQAAPEVVDTIKVTKAGYRKLTKAITKFDGIHMLNIAPGLPPGDLKIISERGMPQVDWGSNVDVQVWDGGTQLKGDDRTAPFEGPTSWFVTFQTLQTHNAWGFVTKAGPEDMSAWKDGHMHIAAKGTVKELQVTMASYDQAGGMSVKVDLSRFGYKNDNKWYSCKVPLTEFTGTDFSNINVYLGLVVPDSVFSPDEFYYVDDVYWKTTPQ